VRQAFALALDRETVAGATLALCYLPASGGLVPPGMPGHTPGIALRGDPDRARQLLAEAGYPGGQGFPAVHLLTWPRLVLQTKHLQGQWRENLGLEITSEVMAWADYLDEVGSHPPRLHWMGWMADYPDPDNFLRVALLGHSAWRNETYDRLVEQARRVTDQEERMVLYRQAERMLVEEVPILPVSYERTPWLVKPWVRNFGSTGREGMVCRDVVIERH
jgi:ABC-type transport system substrate-binding protein